LNRAKADEDSSNEMVPAITAACASLDLDVWNMVVLLVPRNLRGSGPGWSLWPLQVAMLVRQVDDQERSWRKPETF
jgi:hypothetical protein